MGQSASSQSDREGLHSRNAGHPSQISSARQESHNPSSRPAGQEASPHAISTFSSPSHQTSESHPSQPIATFSRQISAQSIPVLRGGSGNNRDVSTRDEIFYEQHEERPLVHMEDLGMRNAPITHITASPMPRRSSRLARLSSMVIPRYAATGSSEGEQPVEGQGRSLRRRLSNTYPPNARQGTSNGQARRSSWFGSLAPRSSTTPRARQRREFAPISRPFPLSPDTSFRPSSFSTTPSGETNATGIGSTALENPRSRLRSFRDGSRLARVRRSISSPFEAFLPTAQSSPAEADSILTAPQRPSRLTPIHHSDSLLPPLNVTDPSIVLDGPDLDPSSFNTTASRLSGISTVPEAPERIVTRADGPSWTERWTERGSTVRRESRRMPSMLRGRSTRLIRRENEGPLPRILHLAATAIAAQLSGAPEQPVPDMQAIGPDDLDGSLQNLFRTLQNASNISGDRLNQDDPSRRSASPPLNFLRVFRFVNQDLGTERFGAGPRPSDRHPMDDTSEDLDGRTVTLVVVGVRSVPSETTGQEDTVATEPNLDTLLNLPPHAPTANPARHGASGLLRHANGRARFPHRRRASIGGSNTFPANYDSQRHQRALSSSSGQGQTDVTSTSTTTVLSDSPPGPHPPPSTPAEPGLSAYSSAATTPSRRPSSASAIHQPSLPNRDIASQHLRETGIPAPEDQSNRVQQRRRSDSEFARHRDLGAGAARRNGVVEPDEVDTGDVPASGSRSWLIYVVGTNLSEDHPALTTPSLFTDVSYTLSSASLILIRSVKNPTYEDMLLLSSLLGPAKPPVASREDVASASGTYFVQRNGEALFAIAIQGLSQIRIAPNERCLVCLENYEVEEEVRQLTKCSHLFHRECIDQVRLDFLSTVS